MGFSMSQIGGVIPALVTCFDEQDRFDEGRMRNVVRFLLGKGIHGLYLTGSTGESFMMEPAERRAVVEVVMDEVGGQVPVIVHVGAVSTKLTCDLAEHARLVGADAVSSVPPIYWNFSSEDIVSYYTDAAQAAGIPMVVYAVPMAGGMSFDMIRRLSQVPGVEGIKYTGPNQHEYFRIRKEIRPEFRLYSGMDEMAYSGICYGADGIIGTTYNLIPEVFVALWDAVQSGDHQRAVELQACGNQVIHLGLEYDYISVIKQMMVYAGVDAGVSRKPFQRYTAKEAEEILQRFYALGIQEEAAFFHGMKR